MKKYIVDTSVVVKLFLVENNRDKAMELFQAVEEGKVELLAPSLLLYEMNNCFIINGISKEDINSYWKVFYDWVEEGVFTLIEPNQVIFQEVVKMASFDTKGRGHVSSYDATFHVLAIQEQGIFITADEKHVRKTEKEFGSVEILTNLKL